MTTDQCIEIAEKVWGWKWVPDEDINNVLVVRGRWWSGPSTVAYHKHDCSELINSWQGFGRTVEAMIGNTKIDLLNGFPIRCLNRQQITKEQFWKRTHLAALEALK